MMKYIIFDVDGGKFPVLFPHFIRHDEISDHFRQLLNMRLLSDQAKAVSAGFYSDMYKGCYGESVSLKLKAQEGDTDLILKFLTESK